MGRKAELKTIFTFHTTAAAIATERFCHASGYAGRLIPVPRSITSDCGMAWSVPAEQAQGLEEAIAGQNIEIAGVYEMYL